MSGNVPPSSRAGTKPVRGKAVNRAADLYERFTGHDAEIIGEVSLPPTPRAVCVIGVLDGVLYTTVRDGVTEHYKHDFAAQDRPLLAVSPDGKSLHLIGGRYVFTERGIVDMSDRKNLPARYRR